MKKLMDYLGPGTLVTAAFVGPGTVTVCTVAGVQFGYTLIWALILSILSCIVLQEMAARLGLITQQGLSTVIRSEFKQKWAKVAAITLVLSAIFIGNAAYQAGNISGGILGLTLLTGDLATQSFGLELNYGALVIGAIAFVLLFIGNYKILERVLVALVLVMSIAFVLTAIVTKPNIFEVVQGFVPKLDTEQLIIVLGLIGTTVVPYNLFLHAALVSSTWKSATALPMVRKDTYISIGLGGLISLAIMMCGAAMQGTELTNALDLAKTLEPVFGKFAKYVLAIGLFAAGITSAITAPLAAAYVVKGCFGWSGGIKDKRFRMAWILILVFGVFSAFFGVNPIQIIQFAQVANGILLPVVASFLFWAVNRKQLLGAYVNTTIQNVIGVFVLLVTFALGVVGVYKVMLVM